MSEREYHKNIILEAFTHLVRKVELSSSLNLHDININTEDTFCELLNNIYTDRKFKNLNFNYDGNYTAIDLGDDKKEIAIQVTSTTDRKKVVETLEKYKNEDYTKVVMLYCQIKKPIRKNDFNDLIKDKFDFEEWDLSKLLNMMPFSNLNQLKEISELLARDIISNIPDITKQEDFVASDEWGKTNPTDFRNITDKLKSACSTIKEIRIKKYCMDIASGQVELDRHSDRVISAMKYRIFEVCQNELIEFVENQESDDLTQTEIIALIEKYTNRAFEIIQDRSLDYSYPLKNRDILRKIVLALIDECYLSFDEEGIYS
jgi:hypothetical protein